MKIGEISLIADREMNGLIATGCAIGAALASLFCCFLFNRVPAEWFCDYNEKPDAELYGKRLFLWPHGILMALILTASFTALYAQFSGKALSFAAGCVISVILLLISAADSKYSIIPDQFVLVFLFVSLVFSSFDILSGQMLLHSGWMSPVLGAAVGAALMLLLAFAGKFFLHKEALGFGDVKLFAVIGLLSGFPGILPVFFLAIFLAFFYIVYLFIRGKIKDEIYLPLGPFLCLAQAGFLAFHRQINLFIHWYLSLLGM
jgi:prepilin signal peptidase PulO-like enzyme (type II secretory pathway)